MKYIVAVSGGVDSVVLLDMLVKGQLTVPSGSLSASPSWCPRESWAARQEARGTPARVNGSSGSEPVTLVVAHFEHGIRGEESLTDQKFVEDLAKKYGLEFVTMSAHLGANVSEADARAARYNFLQREAKKHGAIIVTAHHADDAIETIAINLERGTGWRGLAALDSQIVRPLLAITKQEILEYAQKHNLEWREDSTNHSDAYLRNRVRQKLVNLDNDTRRQLLALRAAQTELKRVIDAETKQILSDGRAESRYFFTMIDDQVADETLRRVCIDVADIAPARPARARMLHAIKTARPGTIHQSMDGFWLTFTARAFQVHHTI